METVSKVILAWFKFTGNVPDVNSIKINQKLKNKLVIKQIKEDNLMLRFIPFTEIQTDGKYVNIRLIFTQQPRAVDTLDKIT